MDSEQATTIHVRRTCAGHAESLAWLAERFAPALLAQARYRLRSHLSELYDPEDLVQDAWVAALPRLADLQPRDGRLTPVLLRFLSKAVLNRYAALMKKHISGKPLREPRDGASERADPLTRLPSRDASVTTLAARRESSERLLAAIDELSEKDREVLVLRSIEQATLQATAACLGISENAVSIRHHRALRRLRERVPDSIFTEMHPEGPQ